MEFIKIANAYVAKNHIVRVVYEPEYSRVIVQDVNGHNTIAHEAEATALLALLENPSHTYFLQPSESQKAYQFYRQAGGAAPFSEWEAKFKRHQNLMQVENLTDAQMHLIRELEEFLAF